jgi:hypothetical protein
MELASGRAEEIRSMPNDKRLLRLQRQLAQAERIGDNLVMARGYLVLAGELLKIGNHRLGVVFIEKACECLSWIGSSPSCRDEPRHRDGSLW